MWPFGAMGESPANAHRNVRPLSPLPTGRLNSFQWQSIADCRLTLTGHFRLGFEPIVEIATILFATEIEELVGPFSNLLANLFSRFSQFLFFAFSVLPLFHSVVPTSPERLPMVGYLRIACEQTVFLPAMSPHDRAARQVPVPRHNQSRLRH